MSRHGFSLLRQGWLCLGFPVATEHFCVVIEFSQGYDIYVAIEYFVSRQTVDKAERSCVATQHFVSR